MFRHLKKYLVRRWAPETQNSTLLLRRSLGTYLQGSGIEIGALHQPLSLEGLAVSKIQYVDRLPVDSLRQQYPELANCRLAHVDVIDDGEKLSTFEDSSLDFIIANHFIEHARNPIGVIRNWLTKLKPGGIIYMAVPDMQCTFDSERPLTLLSHLLKDDSITNVEQEGSDYDHFYEYAKFTDKEKAGDDIKIHAHKLFEMNYSIHFHTFVLDSFLKMLWYIRDRLHLPFEIRAYVDTLPKGYEFLLVLSKYKVSI